MMVRQVFRVRGQLSGGHSGLAAQSNCRIAAPNSPPPSRKAGAPVKVLSKCKVIPAPALVPVLPQPHLNAGQLAEFQLHLPPAASGCPLKTAVFGLGKPGQGNSSGRNKVELAGPARHRQSCRSELQMKAAILPSPPLAQNYAAVRAHSLVLAEDLSAEDCAIQSMPDASPVKWHLAHTSWFFETVILARRPGYQALDPRYAFLFNSYYE